MPWGLEGSCKVSENFHVQYEKFKMVGKALLSPNSYRVAKEITPEKEY